MNFGAFVVSRENDVIGTLEAVVLDLTTNEVLRYGVHLTTGRLRDVGIPNSAVGEIDDDLVLNLSLREIESLPDSVPMTGPARMGIGGMAPAARDQAVEISRQTRVECVDGEIGVVEGLVIDELTSEATDLVVWLKDRKRSARIPMAWASSLRPAMITLQCTKAEM